MDINKDEMKLVFEEKAELLKAVGHPVRLCILTKLLFEGSSNVTNLQNCLDVPQSTVSQHLSKLRSAGVVKKSRNGLEINYCVENDEIKKILEILLNK